MISKAKSLLLSFFYTVLTFVFPLFGNLVTPAYAADVTTSLYTDSLTSGWVNWSWSSWVNFDNPVPIFSGSKSIAFGPNGWGALYLHSDSGLDISSFSFLRFSMQAVSANTKFKLLIYDGNNNASTQLNLIDFGGDIPTNSYKIYNIPVSSISPRFIKGIAWQDITGNNQQPVFLDQLEFVKPASLPSPLPSPTPLPSSTSLDIYTDSLAASWINWSWGAGVNLASVVTFTANNPWSAFYLHTDVPVNSSPYQYLSFHAKASSANQQYQVIVYDVNNQPIKSLPLSNFGPIPQDTFKTYNILFSDLGASNRQIKGVAIQESKGQSQPALYIGNLSFRSTQLLSSQTTISPSPTPAPVVNLSGFTSSAGKIFKNGAQLRLKGVNWFGFETNTHVVHGLWARGYKEMISQMKNLGFNAVRLPVCPLTISGTSVSSVDYSKNADLKGLNSLQVLDKVLGELNNQGMYILLDHHRPDCEAISELWYTPSYSESSWITDLKTMANRFSSLPNFLGIDLKNEPHGAATWGTGNLSTDWNKAVERAGQAVLSVNPNLLIFAEGIGENSSCSSNQGHFWGANLEPQRCTPISTSSIPAQKLVLSPHVYGPDVGYQTYFTDPSFPDNMSTIWDTQFGYLTSSGFSLVPGEWGGRMGTNGGSGQDLTLQQTWVNYMKNKHICDSFYWSWNPNSGDTGGILQDDWLTPWPIKMNLLSDYFNTCN